MDDLSKEDMDKVEKVLINVGLHLLETGHSFSSWPLVIEGVAGKEFVLSREEASDWIKKYRFNVLGIK